MAAGTLLLYRYLKEKGSFLARGSVQELCRRAGVYDLMSWEVLSRLSPELKQFLERISVLDRLTWGSCQAVSGMEKGKELMEEAFSVGLLNWDSGEKEPSGHMLLAFRIVLLEQMDEGERRQRCGLAARYYLDSECRGAGSRLQCPGPQRSAFFGSSGEGESVSFGNGRP